MATRKDLILVIEPDPTVRSALTEGVLEATGEYEALAAADGTEGLSLAISHAPDLILMELEMAGLSGKDLMVALNSQGIDTPVIATTREGREGLAVEAFRLGAKDYLTKPFREAEVVAAIERVLHEVRLRRERDDLTASLSQAKQALEQRLAEERTLFAIGKSVTSMRNLDDLLNLVIRAAVHVTRADLSAVLVRDDNSGGLILRAGRNLPAYLQEQMGHPVEDDLASLVMASGEPLLASGEGIRRRHVPHDAHSVIYVPLAMAEQTVGIVWVGNQSTPTGFNEHQTEILSALADYAAIAVVNARMFQVMDQRARRLEYVNMQLQQQQEQQASHDEAIEMSNVVRPPLEEVRYDLGLLRTSEERLHPQNEASLDVLDRKLGEMLDFLREVAGHADEADVQ